MHEELFTACSSFVRRTDRPDMTVAADWGVKQQIIKLFVRIHHVSYLPFMPDEISCPHPLLGGICHVYGKF